MKFFDYETESKQNVVFPRNHFRNMHNLGSLVGFNFEIVERGKVYDIYSEPKTKALIYVVGGDAHCHKENQLGRYQEGIAVLCEEKDKEELIKEITKVK